jgi:transcriptional regulator with XRE-family HTH domain
MEIPMLVPMPPTLDQIARDRIKAWMAATHTTQETLGQRIGSDQSWVSTYLSGDHPADLEELRKMAELFGSTFQLLFAEAPGNPKLAKFFADYLALPPKLQAHLEGLAADMRAALTRRPRRRRRESR